MVAGVRRWRLQPCRVQLYNLCDVISLYSLNPGKLPGHFSYKWPKEKLPEYEANGNENSVCETRTKLTCTELPVNKF